MWIKHIYIYRVFKIYRKVDFLLENWMSELNSWRNVFFLFFRKYNSFRVFRNPFFQNKKKPELFSRYIVIFKGNYLTCHVRHTKYKSGNTLSRRWSIIWLMFIHIIFFSWNFILSGCKENATFAQIIIRHSVTR